LPKVPEFWCFFSNTKLLIFGNFYFSKKSLNSFNILITIILPYWALLNFGKLIPPKEKIIHLVENKIYNSLKKYFKCTK
ncbi:hypothetical protein, partial [Capnocytophaga bilenii]|uniref:hypothetical protein n=1 Tax=Capnocytophaga bilenii TaxID=2819369 RepID=UPI0028D8FF85